MERIRVTMVLSKLDRVFIENLTKTFPTSKEFYIRNYIKGEENKWAKIEASVGEFPSEKQALEHFQKEFGQYRNEMEERCFFIIDRKNQKAIGTTTAWYNNNFEGEVYGRIHWVGILPEFQGKKLAKPLLARSMLCLLKYHDKAYLTSQTTSYKAINMYLNFGFTPKIVSSECKKAWGILEEILEKKLL